MTWQSLVAALQVHKVDTDMEIYHILPVTHYTAYNALSSPLQASANNYKHTPTLINLY